MNISDPEEYAVDELAPRRRRKSWFSRLACDAHRRPYANLANAVIVLKNDEALKGAFARDLMSRVTTVTARLPGDQSADAPPRPVRDCDVARVQRYLQLLGLPRIGRETINDAIDLVAEDHAHHPVRDWLSSLQWDHKKRLDSWLSVYLGVDFTPYSKAIGRMFLIAMVARASAPGGKADYLLVLEGKQGAGKSAACRILGGDYFSDALPDIRGGKDISQHIRDKWLVEIAELSAISKAEVESLKSFISREIEIYRPAYGRREVHEKRQCVFIGTTNRATYLRDETGGRRFWPVTVGRIDLDRLAADREQLFAEAIAAYRDGARWWPDRAFEAEVIAPQQEARFEDDAWREPIERWLADKTQTTIGECAVKALCFDQPKIGTADQRRIATVLGRIGWERGARTEKGRPWIKPATA
jgi:predicted P-loop ATPase